MLKNWINAEDARRLRRKLAGRDLAAILNKVRGNSEQKVVRAWDGYGERLPQQWWEIEQVRRRWNHLVTGDSDIDFPQWAVERYLAGRSGLRAISVGCGHGAREIRWAELGVFERIDAYDISPKSIATAMEAARKAGLDHVVRFEVADVMALPIAAGSYDVALGLHSLHHFKPVEDILRRLAYTIGTEGLMFVDDFVGPRFFQWTPRQLEAANAMLRLLPARYRAVDREGVRERVVRPSRLWMRLSDPSEAVEADKILSVIRSHFTILEERPYGGPVLHLALTDVSQNFLDGSEETDRLLQWCFDAEDRLLADGEVGSDFVTLVARPYEGMVRTVGASASS